MRRWNGWGEEQNSMELPSAASDYLQKMLGATTPLTDATLAQVIAKVPPSRLPKHLLISTDAELRVRHAKGQSLADWLAMRSGAIDVFPDGVAFPENSQDIKTLLAFAQQHNIVLIPYGGGTSVAGHINPKKSSQAVLTVNLSRMNQLQHLDEESLIATFDAGTPGPMVEAQLRAKGYTLGHFPQSFELSTIGGWVASRSSGQQSLRYGRIEQLFAGGSMETFSGTFKLPTFPASSAGPDFREVVLGSEGRFGIISEVKVRVSKLADQEQFYVYFFPHWQQATQFCQQAVQARIPLSMLRVSNALETQTQLKLAGHIQQIAWLERYLQWRGAKKDKCMLTLGITGSKQQISSSKKQLKPLLKKYKAVSTGQKLGRRWSENRFKFPYLREALWHKGVVVDTLETATDWCNVDQLLAKIEHTLTHTLAHKKVHAFTHLSHVYGQGCSLYTTYLFTVEKTYQQTFTYWQKLKQATSQVIVNNGGTISHQHGVGKDHAPYLVVEKGEQGMALLKQLCQHFDTQQLLNPSTLIDD